MPHNETQCSVTQHRVVAEEEEKKISRRLPSIHHLKMATQIASTPSTDDGVTENQRFD